MLSSVSGSSRWGSPTSFSCSLQLLARKKEHLCGKRRIRSLLHSGSFPSDLGWQSEFFPHSHLHTVNFHNFSWFLVSPAPISAFLTFAFATWFPGSSPPLSSSSPPKAMELCCSDLLPGWAHPSPSSNSCRQGHSTALLSTPWSSFLVESHPFLIGFVWGLGLASPVITFFQKAIHQNN